LRLDPGSGFDLVGHRRSCLNLFARAHERTTNDLGNVMARHLGIEVPQEPTQSVER
jgi:hypothetical protein